MEWVFVLKMYTPNMCNNVEGIGKVVCWQNVKFVWKFSCEDCKGNKHFYVANISISDTREHNGDFWEVKKIG